MTGPQADRIVVDPQGGDDARSPANSHVLQSSVSGEAGPGNYYINRQRAVREREDVNETTSVTSARFIPRYHLEDSYETLLRYRRPPRASLRCRAESHLGNRNACAVTSRDMARDSLSNAKQRGEESTRALISVMLNNIDILNASRLRFNLLHVFHFTAYRFDNSSATFLRLLDRIVRHTYIHTYTCVFRIIGYASLIARDR